MADTTPTATNIVAYLNNDAWTSYTHPRFNASASRGEWNTVFRSSIEKSNVFHRGFRIWFQAPVAEAEAVVHLIDLIKAYPAAYGGLDTPAAISTPSVQCMEGYNSSYLFYTVDFEVET